MKNRAVSRNQVLAGFLLLVLSTQSAFAGAIFTTRASFLAALGGAPLAASEDFESFVLGPVLNPFTIMGGLAEIIDTVPAITTSINTVGGPSPSQAWIANVGSAGLVSITGIGGGALGFAALGFDYADEVGGAWSFVHSLGMDIAVTNLAGPPVLDKFIGWIGAGGEVLTSASIAGGGKVIDNMVAYSASVPEPATTALLALGLLGLGLNRRRQIKI